MLASFLQYFEVVVFTVQLWGPLWEVPGASDQEAPPRLRDIMFALFTVHPCSKGRKGGAGLSATWRLDAGVQCVVKLCYILFLFV
jgi:hypothetical protein